MKYTAYYAGLGMGIASAGWDATRTSIAKVQNFGSGNPKYVKVQGKHSFLIFCLLLCCVVLCCVVLCCVIFHPALLRFVLSFSSVLSCPVLLSYTVEVHNSRRRKTISMSPPPPAPLNLCSFLLPLAVCCLTCCSHFVQSNCRHN